MEGIVTLLDGFYADLVPKSLEAGLSLILQDLGPLLFLHLFSCFFFFGFYNLKLPLRFLSSLHNSHRKSGGICLSENISSSPSFKEGLSGSWWSALLLCQKTLFFTRLKYHLTNPVCTWWCYERAGLASQAELCSAWRRHENKGNLHTVILILGHSTVH